MENTHPTIHEWLVEPNQHDALAVAEQSRLARSVSDGQSNSLIRTLITWLRTAISERKSSNAQPDYMDPGRIPVQKLKSLYDVMTMAEYAEYSDRPLYDTSQFRRRIGRTE